MNIHENTALLDAFVDGELTSEEMIFVQSHLDECPECRASVSYTHLTLPTNSLV